MLEKALTGKRGYWLWIIFLTILSGIGFYFYLQQLDYGLGITGMSRDVSWGLYIAQFTFLVGIAASAVMLVLPYYLHDYKAFGRITVLGEFLAVSAVLMCIAFVFIDLGRPERVMNVLLYPSPTSILFWDMIVLSGYLIINIITGWTILSCNVKGIAAACLGEAAHHFIHSLGHQHPHRYGLYLRGTSGQELLAYGNYGSTVFGLGLCVRPGAAHYLLPDPETHRIV